MTDPLPICRNMVDLNSSITYSGAKNTPSTGDPCCGLVIVTEVAVDGCTVVEVTDCPPKGDTEKTLIK